MLNFKEKSMQTIAVFTLMMCLQKSWIKVELQDPYVLILEKFDPLLMGFFKLFLQSQKQPEEQCL